MDIDHSGFKKDEMVVKSNTNIENDWWKKSVIYQIYPKSFMDSDGDGVGDLKGIIRKLDYLAQLGVDVIWLTPVYESPQKDNGYDISDYYRIDETYGTLEDFDVLIQQARERNIKIIMDLVVNHTSTEHEWFKQSRSSKDNEKRSYYIWKESKDGKEPNNWVSKFGGSAWKFDEITDEFFLHLFDQTQADLNWENEEMRKQVYEIMHFWLQRGVEGFRLDVINLISKNQCFPSDESGDGRKYYTDGPKVHELIHEMNREVFSKYRMITVGEMSSTTIDHCIRYTNPDHQELDMVFNFHHLKVDYLDGNKWELGSFDLVALKRILSEWQVEMHKGGGWNALFWCNHDQPRIVGRYGDDDQYREESAKMLATTIHMMQGTPYIYQGEEIGMTDPKFDSIHDYRDVESLNMFKIMQDQGRDVKEIMDVIQRRSRDNSRTPMQWDSSQNAGFTEGDPWIKTAPNCKVINVESALENPDSVFYHYQHLIKLRKELEIITSGDYQLILEDHQEIFSYLRNGENEKVLVVNNFSRHESVFELPEEINLHGYQSRILISNYEASNTDVYRMVLRPYESIVYHFEK
ncbi:trehalose-6-phosphate hydrolase [Paenibacillus sp. PvR052]|nr:trehalose-6-phosphate hydrolase [Paenibacillus sp. PvP091]MBP1171611.1 trehalose-6-phosphate hydrolase [Paenibacillus sp. PvR098]MBP2437992.1 trehalose-6-phosphate hydrolase [Paenibacillus sp. PvP052]